MEMGLWVCLDIGRQPISIVMQHELSWLSIMKFLIQSKDQPENSIKKPFIKLIDKNNV